MTTVNPSRRELSFLLALLGRETVIAEEPPSLKTKIYHPDRDANLAGKPKMSSRIFFGTDHSGFQLEMHETVLAAGVEAHPPHQHPHQEIIIVMEGTVQTYVEGKTEVSGPGSVIYYGSNQRHNSKNVGQAPSRYYVLELRGKMPS